MTATGAGSKNDDKFREAYDQAPWRSVILCRDNLIVNDGIVAQEEKALNLARSYGVEDREEVSLMSTACCADSAVLAMKPLYKCSGEHLSRHLVKIAHVLESGRTFARYLAELKAEIAEFFELKQLSKGVLSLY